MNLLLFRLFACLLNVRIVWLSWPAKNSLFFVSNFAL